MIELDLSGLNCPLPVLKTKKFLSQLEKNIEVQIYTTDPASIDDFKDFCNKTGNMLVSQSLCNNIITTVIKKTKE